MNEERPPTAESADQPDDASVRPAAPASADPSGDASAVAHGGEPESVESLVDELEIVAERAAASTDDGDLAFGEHLDPETLAFGAPKPQAIVCQWCNGALETADLDVCPHCGSRLRPTDDDLIVPGVTTLSAEAARALELVEIQRNREAAKTGQAMYTTPSLATAAAVVPAPDEATVEAANRPPDDEVRRVMLEMELEARQARAAAAARSDIEAMIVADAAAEAEASDDERDGPEGPDGAADLDAAAEPDTAAQPGGPPHADASTLNGPEVEPKV
ncbi:MAG: hypothetical protein ABWY52_05450 [Candidatus Limnocylindrales bacterium]